MKRIIKENSKLIIGIIIGLVISVSGVYAASAIIESKEVAYDNSNSHGTYTNVQDTIDELYERSGLKKTKWTDPILNGADPVLNDLLIPVTIDSDGNVYYANEYTEWYNYKEKRWANAVILNADASEKYSTGMQISDNDIESYFVWIPRYQYKIWDLGKYENVIDSTTLKNSDYESSPTNMFGKARIIDVVFGNVNEVPKMSEPSSTGVYYTHPAFTLGSKELNGIWVGKFETGYKGAKATNQAHVNSEEKDSVIIKPNVYSWRYINVKNMFLTSFNYKRSLDSHMIKNTEWGAVAYLSHSQYGIGAEININNASDYKTGYSAASTGDTGLSSSTKTQLWNTPVGYLASTTGNISGIYDMSGGAWEYVAACVDGKPGDSTFKADELSNYMTQGYIDKYPSDATIISYNKRILGDATGEMGPFYMYRDNDGKNRYHNGWYMDIAYFVDPAVSWYLRDQPHNYGVLAGIFSFDRRTGIEYGQCGFRIALAPSN